MEWNDRQKDRLRALWAQGHSASAIAALMNTSKNAIVGKAHRLNLPARPCPIKRGGDVQAPRVRRVRDAPPLAPLACAEPLNVPPLAPLMRDPAQRVARTVAPQPCCWPIGEPRAKGFHLCEALGIPGKPYCEEHAAMAYVRVKEKREAA